MSATSPLESAKPSLFLSYARGDDIEPFDPATAFVARLHRDLTAAGFDVWYDRVSMPSRALTFHQEIRDAVAACDRLVLVIGPKAAESLYVRQEWQFAYFWDSEGAAKVQKIVTPILRLGDLSNLPDELKLLDCEDFRDDSQYDRHFQKLIRQLTDPPPALGKLIGVPSLPPHFLSRSDRLTALRDALRADLDRPVVITGAAARVGMHGMGGIGKSVLAATLSRDRKVREAFPDGIVWVGLGPLPMVADLQRRVHKDLGGDGAFQTEHEGRVKLRDIFKDKGVLLILDDVWRREDVDWFDILGPRCRAMITTRDAGLLTSLGGVHHQVELLTDAEALNLLAQAAGVERDKLPSEAADLIAECGRLPLAVALCGGLIRHGFAWAKVLEQLRTSRIDRIKDPHPAKVEHENIWNAIDVSVKFLGAAEHSRFLELAVFPSDEATPLAAVQTLWSHTAGFDDWDTNALVLKLSQRSLLELTTSADGKAISLHDLVYDYVHRAASDEAALHQRLLEAYRKKCPDGWHVDPPNDGYFFTHLRHHLLAAKRVGELADLLREWRWLEAKNQSGLTSDLTADYHDALGALATDDCRCKILRLLDEALRRDLPFVVRHPSTLFQCMWNSCWWYDCLDAADHYEPPKSGWETDNPPWQQPGPKLSEWMQVWRQAKEQGAFIWARALRPPNVPLGGPLRVICTGHSGEVIAVAFSPDGQVLASGSYDRTLRLWDRTSGCELACLRGHQDLVLTLSWSPDGQVLASGSLDKTVRLWDRTSGRKLACLQGHKHCVFTLSWSPDGQVLASGSGDKTVRLWDRTSGRELACLKGHQDGVSALCWSPDGQVLASGSDDKTVRLWDRSSGRELTCIQSYQDYVTALCWSPDGQLLASASNDKTVRLWDRSSGRELACLHGHQEGVSALCWSPDGKVLASGSIDKTVRLWDRMSGGELACLQGHQDHVSTLSWSPDGQVLASGSGDKTVRLWDRITGLGLGCFRGHQSLVRALSWSADSKLLASGSRDKTVRLWDRTRGRELARLQGHQDELATLGWSPNGQVLATGSRDKTVRLWDLSRGRELACLQEDREWARTLSWSPDGQMLAIASYDNTVRLWDWRNDRVVASLQGHQGGVHVLSWSPDGQILASGSDDNTVRLWERTCGRELACLQGHKNWVRSLCWSPDGQVLASGSLDGTVRLWDRVSGPELACLRGHDDLVSLLCWSPDGRVLASGSDDHCVRLWDRASRRELACLRQEWVHTLRLSWSSDCQIMRIRTYQGKVLFWNVIAGCSATPEEIEHAGTLYSPNDSLPEFTAETKGGEVVFTSIRSQQQCMWFPAGAIFESTDGLTWYGHSGSEVILLRLERAKPPGQS